ncbi:MAG: DUF2786 domain-containing protein [Acidimicrobiales bacterium]
MAQAIDSVIASFWSNDPYGRKVSEEIVDYLAFDAPTAEVEVAIEQRIAAALQATWERGWLPREVIRELSRKGPALHAAMITSAVASHYRMTPSATISQAWHEHVASLDLPDVRARQWMTATRVLQRSSWLDIVDVALRLIGSLGHLGRLEPLLAAPGVASPESPAARRLVDRTPSNNPMLEKIRSLLALAESTTFEAEAEAFTAKAQALMTRHSLDEATVWGAAANRAEPTLVRIPVDDPHAGPKSFLLQVVADASNCQAAYHPQYAMSSVVGFESDLVATEVLFTSLLVQAQAAMQRYTGSVPAGTRARSRGFRSSFLRAYANRVGVRLQEVNAHERDQRVNSSGGSLLPVFVAREEAVTNKVEELFTITRSRQRRDYDAAGWAAGEHAAESAELGHAVGPGA